MIDRPELTVECPTCHRPPGRQCVSKSGHGRVTHSVRYRAVGIDPNPGRRPHPCPWCDTVWAHENGYFRHVKQWHPAHLPAVIANRDSTPSQTTV